MVKNPPANAGDTGSIPGPGRFQMSWGNNLITTAETATREAATIRNLHIANREQSPLTATRKSRSKDPVQPNK